MKGDCLTVFGSATRAARHAPIAFYFSQATFIARARRSSVVAFAMGSNGLPIALLRISSHEVEELAFWDS